MAQLSSILRSVAGGRVMFWCPGCDSPHQIPVSDAHDPGRAWGWNGSAESPTFTPSILVSYSGSDAGVDGAPPAVCHSFVVDGRIQFLGDCTHEMAGQTVDIPVWPRPDWGGA